MTTEVITEMTTLVATLEPYAVSVLWIVIVSYFIAFLLAFGVGANDVANSFGTSVGSGVLTLRQACILATIFEIAGAITLGYKVSSTIRTGMFHEDLFAGEEKRLMLGYLSALIGGAIWNLAATFAGLPVSGTHSIVGAIVGFAVVAKGFDSIEWIEIAKIVGSWFASPLLSGLISVLLYLLIKFTILIKDNPLLNGLIALPLFYAFVVFVNVFSIIFETPYWKISWWLTLCISLAVCLVVALFVWFYVVPRLREKILSKLEKPSVETYKPKIYTIENIEKSGLELSAIDNITNSNINLVGYTRDDSKHKDIESSVNSIDISNEPAENDDKPEVVQLFTFLQILTACFGSFAHGGNDVSNAIGPLVAVVLIYFEGSYKQVGESQWYNLLFGGIGISVGLWVWGRKVIKTMGNDLTKITPSSGFTIEIGAAFTVLLASKIGFPISTTHCKVGSVVMVGRIRNKEGVNWRLFANIALAWILTVPLSALCSAGAMALLQLSL